MGRAPEWPHRHGVEKNSRKASKQTEWKSRRGAMRRWACKCAFSFSCWFFALRAAVLHFADRRAASAGRPSGLSACVFRGARVSVVRICLFGEKKNKRDCVVATRLTLGTQANAPRRFLAPPTSGWLRSFFRVGESIVAGPPSSPSSGVLPSAAGADHGRPTLPLRRESLLFAAFSRLSWRAARPFASAVSRPAVTGAHSGEAHVTPDGAPARGGGHKRFSEEFEYLLQ
jgi:hypothetical protein